MKKPLILTVILLAAAVSLWLVFSYERTKDNGNPGSEVTWHFGLVRAVAAKGKSAAMEIDEVEFLSGEEAIVAGMEDTGCSRKNISDCIPSLNNDFYIRNVDKSTRTYTLDSGAPIKIFKNPGSPELEGASVGDFVRKFNDPASHMTAFPFKFASVDGRVTELEEQYVP